MDYLKEKISNQKIVFFDVCGTIYDSNTTFDFIEFFFKNDFKFSVQRFFLRSYFGRFAIKIYNAIFKKDFLRSYYLRRLRGIPVSVLTRNVTLFFDKVLEQKKINTVIQLLSEFKKNGCKIVLVSASLDVIIMETARRVQADEYFATKLGVKEGICTGEIEKDLYGHKDVLIADYLLSSKLESTFVTDNFNDVNVYPLVDNFLVVSFKKDIRYWNNVLNNPVIYEK